MIRLRNSSDIPRGGFSFRQDGDKPRSFPGSPIAEDQARTISSYRTANNLPRSTFDESYADLITYNYYRLGGDRKYFSNTEGESNPIAAPSSVPSGGGCRGCGARV